MYSSTLTCRNCRDVNKESTLKAIILKAKDAAPRSRSRPQLSRPRTILKGRPRPQLSRPRTQPSDLLLDYWMCVGDVDKGRYDSTDLWPGSTWLLNVCRWCGERQLWWTRCRKSWYEWWVFEVLREVILWRRWHERCVGQVGHSLVVQKEDLSQRWVRSRCDDVVAGLL